MIRQMYCSVDDLRQEFGGAKPDEALLQAIKDASEFIVQRLGRWIPTTETKTLRGNGESRLFIPPILAVTGIVNGEDTLSSVDYVLHPTAKHWPNGPYTWLESDPDSTLLGAWDDSEPDSVQISGRWGMYEETEASGATVADVTEQAVSAATVLVADGSKLSPGMVLLIGTEQELVTGTGSPTAAVTTLGADLNATDTVLTAADGTKIKAGETIRVGFERMLVKEVQTNSVEVVRGWHGTGKTTHSSGANVDAYRTFSVERGVNGTTAAAHANGTAISKFVTPMNYLCRQIATLMLNKAETGFAGKGGNPESGEVFYYHEFPRGVLEDMQRNYYIPRSF